MPQHGIVTHEICHFISRVSLGLCAERPLTLRCVHISSCARTPSPGRAYCPSNCNPREAVRSPGVPFAALILPPTRPRSKRHCGRKVVLVPRPLSADESRRLVLWFASGVRTSQLRRGRPSFHVLKAIHTTEGPNLSQVDQDRRANTRPEKAISLYRDPDLR